MLTLLCKYNGRYSKAIIIMVKVQTLQRGAIGNIERECIGDLKMQSRNLNEQYHPMQNQREYIRALNGVKMSRMFAKPLIGNIGHGHRDAVICSTISKRSLLPLVTGSADGTIAIWDLPSRSCVSMIQAHSRTVTDVTFDSVSGQSFYSCSDDGYVHKWNIHPTLVDDNNNNNNDVKNPVIATTRMSKATKPSSSASSNDVSSKSSYGPIESWRIAGTFKSIDHHYINDYFATASDDAVQIWSSTRTTPISTYKQLWGSDDTVTTIRYNPSETNLIVHCSNDRGIGLHDTRTNVPLRKTILSMKSNDVQWNPMEPMVFVVGNEDYNAYTFDMRNLQRPTKIYKGHTSAVMSVSWSPTGREFVSGSYDRTIRIFPTHGNSSNGTSRDIYHTKRMQRIFTVNYTLDSKYIISGSDDSNIRLWKSNASEQLGQLTTREESAKLYRDTLIKKYQHTKEIRTIYKSRKVPKVIQNQTKQFQIQKQSQQRKQSNRVQYNNPKQQQHQPKGAQLTSNDNESNTKNDALSATKTTTAGEGKKLHAFTPERDTIVVRQVE